MSTPAGEHWYCRDIMAHDRQEGQKNLGKNIYFATATGEQNLVMMTLASEDKARML